MSTERCGNTIAPVNNGGQWGMCSQVTGHEPPCREVTEREKLIEALRSDAGDYAIHMRGAPMSHELSWDARDQRAWQAAEALEEAASELQRNALEIDSAHVAAHGMVDPITNAVTAGIKQAEAMVREIAREHTAYRTTNGEEQ